MLMWINKAAFNIHFHKANVPLHQKSLTKKRYVDVDVMSFFPFPILPPAPTKSKDLINISSCL